MSKTILITAAVLGVIAIILGAYAAHSLKALLDSGSLEAFQTGVRYQMYHALFLLFVGNSMLLNKKSKRIIFILTLFGIVLFSGSIYGLSTQSISGINFKTIGIVTPIGGLFFISSWVVLLINFIKIKPNKLKM